MAVKRQRKKWTTLSVKWTKNGFEIFGSFWYENSLVLFLAIEFPNKCIACHWMCLIMEHVSKYVKSKFYTKILKTKHRNHKQTNKWTKIKVTFVIIIHAKLVSNNHVRHNFYTCRLMRLFFVWPFFELKLL